MRSAKIILSILGIFGAGVMTRPGSSQTPGQGKRIVIAASAVFDGKGGVLHNTRIVIEGSKIVAIDAKAGPVDYELGGLTVMPGWIMRTHTLRGFLGRMEKTRGWEGRRRRIRTRRRRMRG
jgi:hypothetical protein